MVFQEVLRGSGEVSVSIAISVMVVWVLRGCGSSRGYGRERKVWAVRVSGTRKWDVETLRVCGGGT